MNKKNNILILLIIIVSISIYIYPHFEIINGGDSGQYILQSENIYDNSSKLRPPIFSFIILIGKIIFNNNWILFIQIFNWIIYILFIILFYNLLYQFKLNKLIISSTILIFALSPRILLYRYILLPEFFMAFIIFFIFYYIHQTIKTEFTLFNAIIIGTLNAICCLTKPIWILGGLISTLFFIFYLKNNNVYRWKFPITVLICNLSIIFLWQIFLYINFNQVNISHASTRNLNLLSLRSGYFNSATNTQLYNHIKGDKILYELTNEISWDEFERFTKLKSSLNNEITTFDNNFYRVAIKNNFINYIFTQTKRIPNFFTSKCLYIMNNKHLSYNIELYYLRLYKLIYLYILPIFFLIGLVYTIYNKNSLSILLLTFILSYVFLSVFVSYQDQSFVRFRTCIDALIFLFPLIALNPQKTFIVDKK